MQNQQRSLDPTSETEAARKRATLGAVVTAILTTILFFYPSFYSGGRHAAFAFEGDALHALGAQLQLANFYIKHGVFSGIDFFTHNGAAEYFLRPNFPVYQPLALFSALFSNSANPLFVARTYTFLLTIHAFLSVFFLHRLCTRFFRLDVALAAFIAVGFTFSIELIHSFWYLPYPLIAWMLPVAIYCGLSAARARSLRSIVWSSLPTFFMYTGGYIPLATVAVSVSVLFIAGYELHISQRWPPVARFKSALWALMPCFVASFMAAPFYISVAIYHRTVDIANRAGADALSPTAYQLSELPRSIPRLIAENLNYTGPYYELALFWGLVPLLIFVIYLAQYRPAPPSARSTQDQREGHRALLRISLVVYLFFALAIFGPFSAVSNIFYYFVPVAGYMHIYQRYLSLAHFFFALFIGLMLHEVVSDQRRSAAKILAGVLGLILLLAVHLVDHPLWAAPAITNAFVIELLLALLFLIGLIMFERRGAILAATAMMFLVSLGAMYHYSDDTARHYEARVAQQFMLDPAGMDGLAAYFKKNSNKAIIKYVDLIPGPQPYIPKNLPWVMLNRVKLSSYFGYDWHLGVNYEYRVMMPALPPPGDADIEYRPDWDWLRMTGAEFVLFKQDDTFNDPKLADYIDLSDPSRMYALGGDLHYMMAPLKFPPLPGEPVVFDNGYIRIHSQDSEAKVSDFSTNDAGNLSFTVETSQPAEVQYLFWPNPHTHVYLDGNTASTSLQDRLLTTSVPAGKHSVAFSYQRALLTIFLFLYGGYASLVLLLAGYTGAQFIARRLKNSPASRGRFP
jgi:hypothetical protein